MGIVALILALFTAGAVLLIVALRGKRVGDHPHCRACGFDLFGRPSESTRCPECGADVTKRRATVIGERQRRRRVAGIGAIVMIAALALGGASIRQANIQERLPLWALRLEADHGTNAMSNSAFGEIGRRMRLRLVDSRAVEQLISTALARQRGPAHAWRPQWADLVERAWLDGKLSKEQWNEYAENAIRGAVRLSVRPRVRRGDPIAFELTTVAAGWRGPTRFSAVRASALSYLFDDGIGEINSWKGFDCMRRAEHQYIYSTPQAVELTPDVLARLGDGPRVLRGVVRIDIEDLRSRTAIRSIEVPVSAPYTLLPSDDHSVVEQHEPKSAEAIRAALSPSLEVMAVGMKDRTLSLPNLVIRADAPPVALACDVYLIDVEGKSRISVGSVCIPKGSRQRYTAPIFYSKRPGNDDGWPAKCDVVLEPSKNAALRSTDLTEYWTGAGPIEFKDVPVNVTRRSLTTQVSTPATRKSS